MPSRTDFTTLTGEAEVAELTVRGTAPVAGLTLSGANERGLLDDEVLVVAIERDGDIVTPHGGSTLREGDIATVFARDGLDERTEEAFVGSDPAGT
jgi:Trk K+ transport system NAD-binding subunit